MAESTKRKSTKNLMNSKNDSVSSPERSRLSKTQRNSFFKNTNKFNKSHLNATQQQPPSDEISSNEKMSLKDVIDNASVQHITLNLIDDNLELFNNQKVNDSEKGNEKYELIDKAEFEKMKKDNVEFKALRKKLQEEYKSLKENFDKVNYELQTQNYNYHTVEMAKTESITKLFQMENELKKILIDNNKLQNEIIKENEFKINIFRALNEFKRKYGSKIPKELENIFKQINNKTLSPVLEINNSIKLGYLEEKLQRLQKELQEKDSKIEKLSKNIKENQQEQ
jgi:hypothetical protein